MEAGLRFLGKRILRDDPEADSRSFGKTSMRERRFQFQRSSCNFSPLTGNWQLYRDGKRSRCTNRLFNGCRNCGHKHRDPCCESANSACVWSPQWCDTRKPESAACPLVPLENQQLMANETTRRKAHKDRATLLVNGACLFWFTIVFCSKPIRCSENCAVHFCEPWHSSVLLLWRRAPVLHLREKGRESSIRRTCSPRGTPTHCKPGTRVPTPARLHHVTSSIIHTDVTQKTHRYIWQS